MTWLPEWRITVGTTVYTNVTGVNLTTGRIDIDRQCQAGYARMDIINSTNALFDIDVTDSLTLELKDSDGDYVVVFGGTVSDFSTSVRSPEESGYVTLGTILAVGALAKLPKAIYTDSVAHGLDGEQIAIILQELLINEWQEVAPSLQWEDYDPTTTWANAENVGLGEIDSGLYQMDNLSAADRNTQTLVQQIADSALGNLYEDKQGRISYADADHRSNYLAANGSTQLDGNYASPASVKSILQVGKIRNSEIVRYGNDYGSTYSATDDASVTTYGRYQRTFDSNIRYLADITDIITRDLALRATPRTQLDQITFRLDNPLMPDALRDDLINLFFGEPVVITNLPFNMFEGYFSGFVEGISIRANASFVDATIYVSPTDFSLIAPTWATVIPTNTIWSGVNGTLQWSKAIGALT
ncbi:hypothetical protein UFOVP439_22 [uncultured Caudovirales phage]|uniref:Uncharacterized protein n=1 Tax=uncultured Caudovirales phage TaxID=2100421 RepID=A0A6J5MB78_9CAUD|nr:hypothetical protein UFOVP439_22 [uncultured Caudovirales phage]